MVFVGMTIVQVFTGGINRWGGSFAPIGWNAYIKELPTLLLFCLVIGVIIVKLYSVWSKHYDEEDKKKWEEVRKRLAERDK